MNEELEELDLPAETMETFFITIAAETISSILLLAGLFIIFWGAVALYQNRMFSWRKVILVCLIAGVVLEGMLLFAEVFFAWNVLVYMEAFVLLVTSILFVVSAIAFIRLVNFAKRT